MYKTQRLNPNPETHSPGIAKTTGERSNALSPRSEGRLQTRKTINHRRRERRMSRMNRRNCTRTRGTPTRIPTQIRRTATSRRKRAISRDTPTRRPTRNRRLAISRRRRAMPRARAPASRPRARRPTARHQSGPRGPIGRTRTTIFWHFPSKTLGKKEPANKISDLVRINTVSVRRNQFFLFFSVI